MPRCSWAAPDFFPGHLPRSLGAAIPAGVGANLGRAPSYLRTTPAFPWAPAMILGHSRPKAGWAQRVGTRPALAGRCRFPLASARDHWAQPFQRGVGTNRGHAPSPGRAAPAFRWAPAHDFRAQSSQRGMGAKHGQVPSRGRAAPAFRRAPAHDFWAQPSRARWADDFWARPSQRGVGAGRGRAPSPGRAAPALRRAPAHDFWARPSQRGVGTNPGRAAKAL